MKKKIIKIIFIISFIPYILLILYGLYGAIFGTKGICLPTCPPTYYGINAFLDNIIELFLKLSFIGIIPLCFIYEVIYIIISFKNRKVKNRRVKEIR